MMAPMRARWWILSLLIAVGCTDARAPVDGGTDGGALPPPADAGPPPPSTIGPDERPAGLFVPPAHDGVTPLPAVILLHGYGASGQAQDTYLGLSRAARVRGFYVVIPDGTPDASGRRFWNATPACCDFGGTGVDDVAYITALMDALEATVPVAEGQLFLMGHSNGGFMSYRMACERSERIAGIVSLAGSDFAADGDCVPTAPVAVLQIHGDLDATIRYDGEAGAYPSAPDVVARWAGRNGCAASAPAAGEPLDLDTAVAGTETEVLEHTDGCSRGAALWTIVGGEHIPSVSRDFADRVLQWMAAQGS